MCGVSSHAGRGFPFVMTVGESLAPDGGRRARHLRWRTGARAEPTRAGHRQATLFALANAVVIAVYTVIDALGGASGNAVQYVAALFVLDGCAFALLVLARRGRAGMADMHVHAGRSRRAVRWRRWVPTASALGFHACTGCHGGCIWETSVLFAALLGTWLLKEQFTPRRAGDL